jgi:hypothetical protein
MNVHACSQSAQNINLPAINGVEMQMPEYADSSAENRQGTKMNSRSRENVRHAELIAQDANLFRAEGKGARERRKTTRRFMDPKYDSTGR